MARYQIASTGCGVYTRCQRQYRFLKIVAEHPGVPPRVLGELLFPQLKCHVKMRTVQASVQARRYNNLRWIKIKYQPGLRYYLTNYGYEIMHMLSGEEETPAY